MAVKEPTQGHSSPAVGQSQTWIHLTPQPALLIAARCCLLSIQALKEYLPID